MEHHKISKTDDWWKFIEQVVSFNKKVLNQYHSSLVFVLDDRMRAFIPR